MKNKVTLLFQVIPFFLFAQAPNFVVIVADDMGWTGTEVELIQNDPSSASDFYETPNLQQLATDGMTFSQGYAPAAKCSPTRCAILTGETTARNNFTETGNGVANGKPLIEPSTNTSIDYGDVTLAEWLKSLNLNYRTAHYGKWHLGSGGPASHGFDYGDGATANNEGNASNGNTIQTDPKKMFEITDSSLYFMQNAVDDGVPFYVQLSHYAVHSGIETTQASFDHFNNKPPGAIHDNVEYAGMTKDLDDAIGIVLDSIENMGISGNTYVIFISDNGAGTASDNAPLRASKGYIYDGGIRVPFMVKGPNIPANTFSSTPTCGYDIFPTIAEWTGSSNSLPSTLDGKSLVPLLTGNSFSRDEPLYFHIPHYTGNGNLKTPRSAAVDGNFKLVVDYEDGIFELYDLDTNIGEDVDVSSSYPLVFEEMIVALRDHLKEVSANMPTLDPTWSAFTGSGNDVDNDGLDDTWEFTELLSYHFTATDDPDGDGDDNLTEYNNGTDPLVGTGVGGTVIISDGGFENGWEIWNDGGSDCRRNGSDAPYANGGSFCIRLRDDDANSSFMTTDVLNLTSYDSLTVDFSYLVTTFNSGEDFWLQLSTDGSATYTTIEDWIEGTDFNNNVRENPSVTIHGPFTSNCTLRFRCDASRNNDLMYIDDVVVTGYLSAGPSPIIVIDDGSLNNFNTIDIEKEPTTTLSNMRLFPNPTSNELTIEFMTTQNAPVELIFTDFSGSILMQKEWESEIGRQQTQTNVSDLPDGYYLVQLVTREERLVERLVVIR